MTHTTAIPLFHVPDSVRQDVLEYRAQLGKYLQGETSEVKFKGYRVPMGIYEQRDSGRFMVRIRLGGGIVLPVQLKRIAALAERYGSGALHLTTRQAIQIHEIALEKTADVLEGLLEAQLISRGGGGNTVRNITACPRSGSCPQEEFDVAPHANAVAEYLLQHKGSFNLPRKFKIAFSGCPVDCAYASVADLGFFAHRRGETFGFSVFAGGGLGSNPRTAIQLEEFIPQAEVLFIAQAVRNVFDQFGDRPNKHTARLRYVLNKQGPDKFIERYRFELAAVRQRGLDGFIPTFHTEVAANPQPALDRDQSDAVGFPGPPFIPEKIPGQLTLNLQPPLGIIQADDLRRVAKIAAQLGQALLRVTQLQTLLVPGIPVANIERTQVAIRALSFETARSHRPRLVVCAGASTCKLGLCLSRGLAEAIGTALDHVPPQENIMAGTVIRISGCPNSCGAHHISSIGFEGRAKRINGRLMPCYEVLTDGKTHEHGARLGRRLGAVPAKRIPSLLAEAFSNGTIGGSDFESLVARNAELPASIPDDYFYDFGSSQPFSLAGRGAGECGAGMMDVMRVDITEAQQSLKAAAAAPTDQKSSEVYRSLLAAARALLAIYGLELKRDEEIFATFQSRLIDRGWVQQEATEILAAALGWKHGNRQSIAELAEPLAQLVQRVEALFLSLDANLEFRIEPFW